MELDIANFEDVTLFFELNKSGKEYMSNGFYQVVYLTKNINFIKNNIESRTRDNYGKFVHINSWADENDISILPS